MKLAFIKLSSFTLIFGLAFVLFSFTSIERKDPGKKLYEANCQVCHQATGLGLPGVFPPLAKSDYLMADKKRAIKTILHGMTGEIIVNGKKYTSAMPPQPLLSDKEVADILNYVMNAWGNKAKGKVTAADVKMLR